MIVSLLLGIVALIYGTSLVLPDIMNEWRGAALFIAVPVLIPIVTLSGYSLAAYYIFLIMAIVASCTWVFLTGWRGFLKELTMRAKSREHSVLFDIGGFVTVNFFVSFLIVVIVTALGADDTGVPEMGSTSEMLYALANASVWEELVVRVLLLGLPLGVVDILRRRRDRKWHKYVLGGSLEIGAPELALVVASSTIFGFAHYDGGWGSWKILDAGIGGLTFGYLFLKFGLPSAITLHFAIDYAGMPTQALGFSQAYEIFIVFLWLGLGAVFSVYYIIRTYEFLTGARVLEERPRYAAPPWPHPTQYYYPQTYGPPIQGPQAPPPPMVGVRQGLLGGFVCPFCGGTEARYADGRFHCVRCGRLL